jgi:hypothetical protein
MKIYINNFNIDLLDSIIKQLDDNYVGSETYIQIYSTDGVYQINEKNITKLKPNDKSIKIFEKYYENFTLIVDESYYTKEIMNCLNPEHTSTNVKRCFFKINKTSFLNLVVEGIESINFSKKNKYNINSSDIYFEISDSIDINDALVKKEIIVFLSLLNNIVI